MMIQDEQSGEDWLRLNSTSMLLEVNEHPIACSVLAENKILVRQFIDCIFIEYGIYCAKKLQ